jgi:hypothetical protein
VCALYRAPRENPSFAYGGGGDIGDIARIGQRFMRAPPDSGTPLGNKALDLLTHGGIGLVAPAIGAGGYAAYHGDFPLESTGWGLAGLLAAGLSARGATTFTKSSVKNGEAADLESVFQVVAA